MSARPAAFARLSPGGRSQPIVRAVPVERPVAIEVNGVAYAVMMATPADLADFATGFALSERLVDRAADIDELEVVVGDLGTIARLFVAPGLAERAQSRHRARVADSSCGLCGIESLEAALHPLPDVPAAPLATEAIFAAIGALRDRQPLNAATGGVHAAARCDADGHILDVREDVGRHNAFDKLIGAMARAGVGWDGGFALLSSRCSYELIEKAALSGCPSLVTVSVATSLAIDRAASCGLRLVSLARGDAVLVSA